MENIYLKIHQGIEVSNPLSASVRLEHNVPVFQYYKVPNPKWHWCYIGWAGIILGMIITSFLWIMAACWFADYTGYHSPWLGIFTGELIFVTSLILYTLKDYLPSGRRMLTKSRITYNPK